MQTWLQAYTVVATCARRLNVEGEYEHAQM